MPLDAHDGDRLGALGIVHALGLDPLALSLDRLAEALPAGMHAILRWRLPDDVHEDPDAIENYPRAALEEAASLIGRGSAHGSEPQSYRLGLGDLPAWRKPEWFAPTIGQADRLSLGSAYVQYEPHVQPLTWQWPLRFGFLDDPASRYLFDQLVAAQQASGGWRAKTIRLVPPAAVPPNCGLILVPSKREAAESLGEGTPALRCGALLILDWDGAVEPPTVAEARHMIEGNWASGVLCPAVDTARTLDFCFAMIRELTHNFTVDAALVETCRSSGLRYPLMVGSTTLMRDSRLSRVMGRMTRGMESPRVADRPMLQAGPGGEADHVFPMGGGTRAIAEAARRFEREENVFAHEGDYSVAMADLSEALDETMRDAGVEPEPQGPRFLQCKLTLPGAAADVSAPLTDHFRPGATHRAQVRVGVPDPEWLQPKGEVPFPEHELPPGPAEYELTVVFSVLGGDAIPKSGATELPSHTIRLTRAGGSSTECAFEFDVDEREASFVARILVLFENRILQTGRLTGPVGQRSATGPGIEFEIEAVVSRLFSGLEDGSRFQGALLFNDNGDGEVGVTGAADGRVRISAPQGLADQFDKLNDLVSAMAYDPDTFTGKLGENDELLEHMIAFARDGSDLREIIEQHVVPGSGFDSREPIQVVTKAMGTKIPIEFFYDYRAPAKGARLCPGASASLAAADGACDQAQHGRDVFCPSGFWGLSRVIEYHAFQIGSTQEDFELRNEPTQGRAAISVGGKALFAGTKVVDEALGETEGLARVKARLDSLTERRCSQVATWAEWETAAGSEAPGLLVLLVHTAIGDPPGKEQKLEIGDGQWLLENDIYPEVLGGAADPGPMLLLIGCKTGDAKIRYKSLCERFKRKGASLVVSSNATIHSRHAVPFLASLIDALQRERRDGAPFGEALVRVRREMLADGIPIVLCITAYGDARWVLT